MPITMAISEPCTIMNSINDAITSRAESMTTIYVPRRSTIRPAKVAPRAPTGPTKPIAATTGAPDGKGHDLLHESRQNADQQTGNTEPDQVGGERRTGQGEAEAEQRRNDQGLAFDAIAEWRQEEQADGIADLGEERYDGDFARCRTEIADEKAKHRLIV